MNTDIDNIWKAITLDEYEEMQNTLFSSPEIFCSIIEEELPFYKSLIKNTSKVQIITLIARKIITYYLDPKNSIKIEKEDILIFDKLFVLTQKIHSSRIAILTSMITCALKETKQFHSCLDCKLYKNFYFEIINYDELLDLKTIECNYYSKILDIFYYLIQALNNYPKNNIQDHGKALLTSIIRCAMSFNCGHLINFIGINLCDEFKKIKINLGNPLIPMKNLYCTKIILLHNDIIVSRLLYGDEYDYHNYVIKYLYNKYKKTKDPTYNSRILEEISFIINNDNNLYWYDKLVKYNFFDVSIEFLATSIFTLDDFKFNYFVIILEILSDINDNLNVSNIYKNDICEKAIEICNYINLKELYQSIKTFYDKQPFFLPLALERKIIEKVMQQEYIDIYYKCIHNYLENSLKIKICFGDKIRVHVENNIIQNIDNVLSNLCDETYLHFGSKIRLYKFENYTQNVKSEGPGVTTELLKLLNNQLLDLISTNNVLNLDDLNVEKYMKYYGLLQGYNLLHGIVMIAPNYLYKFMFGQKITLADIDPSYEKYENDLNKLKTMSTEELEDLSLTMSIRTSFEKFGEYNLVENGNQIPVTTDNVEMYVDLIIKYYTFQIINTIRYKNVNSFTIGFTCVFLDINKHENKTFFYQIFEKYNKRPPICKEHLKNQLKCYENKIFFKWMSKYIDNSSEETLKKLLEFITSIDYIRQDEQISIRVTSEKGLPNAGTCYRTLWLPKYDNYDIFESRLTLAINDCIGFSRF